MTQYCRNEEGFTNGCGQFSECLLQASGQYECLHNSAFENNAWVILMYIIMPPFVGLAVLGGLGGGILKGPFLQAILNYSQTGATRRSYCIMLGASILNTILLFYERYFFLNRRHPYDNNRPIINFDVAVIQNLAIPLATYIGVTLAELIPQIYIIIFQVIFLVFACTIVYQKAVQQRELEIKMKQEMNALPNQTVMYEPQKQDDTQQTQQMLEYDMQRNDKFPFISMLIILFSFGLNQLLFQMRSQGSQQSIIGISKCETMNSVMYSVLIVANFIYSLLVWFYGRRMEYQKDLIKYKPEERYYTPFKKFMLIYAGGFAGGFISGFLGLGPGLVMVPVLIHSGLIARVAASTSAFSQFWIGMNNLTTLLTQHLLPADQIGLFCCIGLVGGSVFTKIGYYYMNKHKIGYIVIFFVFWLSLTNIFSSIYYGAVSGVRYSFSFLTKLSSQC